MTDNENNPPKRGRGRPKIRLTPADYLILEQPGKLIDKAKKIGIAPRTLHKLLKSDERAMDANAIALAIEKDEIYATLLAQSKDKANPRSVQAAALLLKGKHGIEDAPAAAVNINLPAPMSPQAYTKLVQTLPQQQPAIEHDNPGPPKSLSFSEMLNRTPGKCED